MAKPPVKSSDLAQDIRNGMNDNELMKKYELSPTQLAIVFNRLLAAKIITQEAFDSYGMVSEPTPTKPIDSIAASDATEQAPVQTYKLPSHLPGNHTDSNKDKGTVKTFSELTGKQKTIEVLRWFGVLPAALIGGFAGFYGGLIFIYVHVYMARFMPGHINFEFFAVIVTLVIQSIALGAATVIAGAMMAPRHRRVTANILVVLWIVLYSYITFIPYYPGQPNTFVTYLGYVLGVIGGLGGAIYIDVVEPQKAQSKVEKVRRTVEY